MRRLVTLLLRPWWQVFRALLTGRFRAALAPGVGCVLEAWALHWIVGALAPLGAVGVLALLVGVVALVTVLALLVVASRRATQVDGPRPTVWSRLVRPRPRVHGDSRWMSAREENDLTRPARYRD